MEKGYHPPPPPPPPPPPRKKNTIRKLFCISLFTYIIAHTAKIYQSYTICHQLEDHEQILSVLWIKMQNLHSGKCISKCCLQNVGHMIPAIMMLNYAARDIDSLLATGSYPDNKVHGANMGPTWVLLSPGGPHVGPMNLAIRILLLLQLETCLSLLMAWWQAGDKPLPEPVLTYYEWES